MKLIEHLNQDIKYIKFLYSYQVHQAFSKFFMVLVLESRENEIDDEEQLDALTLDYLLTKILSRLN